MYSAINLKHDSSVSLFALLFLHILPVCDSHGRRRVIRRQVISRVSGVVAVPYPSIMGRHDLHNLLAWLGWEPDLPLGAWKRLIPVAPRGRTLIPFSSREGIPLRLWLSQPGLPKGQPVSANPVSSLAADPEPTARSAERALVVCRLGGGP